MTISPKTATTSSLRIICVEDRLATAKEAGEMGHYPGRVRFVAYADEDGNRSEFLSLNGRGSELLRDF